MIDKLTLNNEIVLMRNVFRRAKVHVIGKLIREMKKLREKKGDDAMRAKYNRKAERKAEELMVLKKLKPDPVSKFALKNTENPTEKFSDPNLGIEEKAIFKIIANKVMAERVGQFRAQYPDWREYISEMIDELGVNRRKYVKESKNLADKVDKKKNKHLTSEKPTKEGVSKKVTGAKASAVKLLDRSHSLSDKAEVTSAETDLKSKFLVGWTVTAAQPAQKVRDRKNIKRSVKKESVTKAVNGKSLTKSDKSNSNKHCWNVSEIMQSKGVAEIGKFNEFMTRATNVPDKEELLKKAEGERNVGVTPNEEDVDPFFVSSDGKTEYRTSIKISDAGHKDEDIEQTWRREKKPFDKEWGFKKRESRDISYQSRGRGYPGRGGLSNRGREGNRGRGRSFGGRQEPWGGKNNMLRPTPGSSSVGESHLHPSWEAKRKLKEQSISNVVFQGKKMKFDDDDD